MSKFVKQFARKWQNYRYRLVPWVAFNLKNRTIRSVQDASHDKIISDDAVQDTYIRLFMALDDFYSDPKAKRSPSKLCAVDRSRRTIFDDGGEETKMQQNVERRKDVDRYQPYSGFQGQDRIANSNNVHPQCGNRILGNASRQNCNISDANMVREVKDTYTSEEHLMLQHCLKVNQYFITKLMMRTSCNRCRTRLRLRIAAFLSDICASLSNIREWLLNSVNLPNDAAFWLDSNYFSIGNLQHPPHRKFATKQLRGERDEGCCASSGGDLNRDSNAVMFETLGYAIGRQRSQIEEGGVGVYVTRGVVPKGTVVAMYPGTIYYPSEPILLQSLGNPFVFRCLDGILIDGNDKHISKMIYRSCTQRDRLGPYLFSDLSWLTSCPLNPMAVGQYVNNQHKEAGANVCYQEYDVPLDFPVHLRKFIPNTFYSTLPDVGNSGRFVRTVALISLREIHCGEELFSSYFTLVH